MRDYLRLLRERPSYRNLWLAALVSQLGDWFNVIATVILVDRFTDSGTAVGALFLARSLPPFLLTPVVGVIADRFNRKTILIVSDLLRALIVLGFLFVTSAEQAWLIYVLTVAQFIVSAFFQPAKSAILPSLIETDEELVMANTLSSTTWSAMLTLGAAIGGVMAAVFGVQVALIVDALTFVLSAVLVLRIVLPEEAGDEGEKTAVSSESGWQAFLSGVHYIRQRPRVGLVASIKGLGQLGAPDIMIALYAAQIFPTGEDGALALGLLFAFAGLGAILGPIIANLFTKGVTRALQQAVGIGFLVIAAGWLLFGIAPSLPVALLAMTLRHLGGSQNWVYSTILLQVEVPDRYLGRVFAFDFAIFTLAASLSVWLTGLAIDTTSLGPREVSLVLAGLSVLPSLLWVAVNWRVYVPNKAFSEKQTSL
ncbi:MAG: MFS transporter [Chloroflexota bacterium]